jgi:hypothetical protein
MSGSFNTKTGAKAVMLVDAASNPQYTDPIYAENMLTVNGSVETTLNIGEQLTGAIYLQGSNDLGNETPGIGTNTVTNWVSVSSTLISGTAGVVVYSLSTTNFAYRWLRFGYVPDAAASPAIEGHLRFTIKGW